MYHHEIYKTNQISVTGIIKEPTNNYERRMHSKRKMQRRTVAFHS